VLHAQVEGMQVSLACNVIGRMAGGPLRGQGNGKGWRRMTHEGTSVRRVRGTGQFLMSSGGQTLVSPDNAEP
jgi:hypothetical protein